MSNIVKILRRKGIPSPIDVCGAEAQLESGERWLQAESSDYDSQSPRNPSSSGPSPQSSDFGSHRSLRSLSGSPRADVGVPRIRQPEVKLQRSRRDGRLDLDLQDYDVLNQTAHSPPNDTRDMLRSPVSTQLWTSKPLLLKPPCITLREALLPTSGTEAPIFPQFGHSLLARDTNTDSLILFGGAVQLSMREGMRIDEHGRISDEHGVVVDGRGLIDAVGNEYTVKQYLLKTNNVYLASSQALTAILLETEGPAPPPRCGQICAMYGNSLFVWGGDTRVGSPLYWSLDEELYVLNLASNAWTLVRTRRHRPSGRFGHAAAIVGSKLYVFGGQTTDRVVLADFWRIDLATVGLRDSDRPYVPVWECISPSGQVPSGRTGHSFISWRDRIIMFGGSNLTKTFDDTWIFHIEQCSWTRISLLNRRKGGIIPSSRREHAATVMDDTMYIYGGKDRDSNFLNDLSFFNISNELWYSAQVPMDSEAPGLRANLGMTTLGSKLVLLGGEQPPSDTGTASPLTIFLLDTVQIPRGTQNKRSRAASESARQNPSLSVMSSGGAQSPSGWQATRARKPVSYSGSSNVSRSWEDTDETIQIAVVDTDARRVQPVRNGESYTDAHSLDRLLQKLSDSDLDLTGKIEQQGNVAWRQGGHADIYIGHYSLDGRKVAIKRLRFNLHSDFSIATKITRELRVWFKLRHANILPLKGFITQENLYPALITDWMDHGTVIEYVKQNSPVDKLQIIEGVANGLGYLHQEGVVHADLKCGNILVSTSGVPLLMDFGISHLMQSTSTNETATRAEKGTIRWMSPELLTYDQGAGDREDFHTKSSDVWAFGMTMLELLTELPPFSYLRADAQVMLALYRNELPQAPDDLDTWRKEEKILWGMCHKYCWLRDCADRPSMSNIIDVLKGIRLACTVA